MRKLSIRFLSLLLVVMMIAAFAGIGIFTAGAADSTVVASVNGEEFTSLQEAVDAAAVDGTILLHADVDSMPTINKPLTIEGVVEAGIEINCAIAENFPDINGMVMFKNLTFNDRISTENASSDQSKMTLRFEGCTFNVPEGNTYAIQAGSSWNNDVLGELVVESCTFSTSSTSFVKGYMIYAQCVETVRINNSQLYGNDTFRGAIHLGDSTVYATDANIELNTIEGFARGVQIGNRVAGSDVNISSNDFTVDAIDGESESAALYIHEVANAATIDVTMATNGIVSEAPVVFSENSTGRISDFVGFFAGNTVNGTVVTSETEGVYYDSMYMPTGTIGLGYVSGNYYGGQSAIWGEANANPTESFVVEIYAGETLIATTSLVDPDKVFLTGTASTITWHAAFYADGDEWWNTEWEEGYPNINMAPDKVVLYVDGIKVAENSVVMGAPDYETNIVALAEGFTGGVQAYTSLADAIGNFNGRQVNVLRDVTESIESFNGCTLTTNVEGGVTITSTYDGWIYTNGLNIGKGVTVVGGGIFYETDGVNTIEGTLKVTETFYHGYNAKTTVQNGGKIIVDGSTILRYNTDADAGLYIYGDGNAETVEFSNSYYIGAYSGTFYAEDATIETGYFLLKNSYDDSAYADVAMTLDNSTLTVVGTTDGQDSFIIDDQAALTLANGSAIKDVRDFSILSGTDLTLSIDDTSAIYATNVTVADGIGLVATVNEEDGTVTFEKTLKGTGTETDPYLIYNVEELIWFRDQVDAQASDGSTQFAGKYFKLMDNIDLADINWNPIGSMTGDHGSFKGVFDGNGKIISNLTITGFTENGAGLFARTAGDAEIKNLTLENISISSTGNHVGGLVGNAFASTKITNVHVTGNVQISGRGYIGGIAGHGYVVMDDVSVKANEGSTISSTFWCAGGILGYGGEGATNITNASVENLTIMSAAGGLGSIIGMAEDNGGTQPISGSNLSAKNIVIKTYNGGYDVGTYGEYALGYLYGGNPTSILTGTLVAENVTFDCSTGNTDPAVSDVVAKIGDAIYFNLQEAIDAANGETVTLLRDVTAAIEIPNGATVVLDLNGKTLNGSIQAPNADLTVQNGSIVNNDSSVSGIEINAGTLVLEDVNIASERHAVRIDGAVVATINGGEYKVLVNNEVTAHAVNVSGAAEVTINGGTFYGPKGTPNGAAMGGSAVNVRDGAAVVINGGSFSGGVNDTLYGANVDNITVYGGFFDMPVPAEYCAYGMVSTEITTGVYSVKSAVEAKIGNHSYATLKEAIEAAKDGDTILLLADVYLTERITISKNITIADYDTYTINLIGDAGFSITNNATVTFEKFSIDVSDAVVSGDAIFCIGNYSENGTLNLTNVNVIGDGYSSAYAVFYVYNTSTLNIEGGEYNLSNDNASTGGFIKAEQGKDGNVNITDSVINLTDAKIGFLDGKVTLNGVELTIKGGANAINGSALTVIDSTVTVDGADGRALTLSQGDVTIQNSKLYLSNCSEGEIRFKSGLTLTVDATSEITACDIYADASAVGAAKVNDQYVTGSESNPSTIVNATVTNPDWVAKVGDNQYYMTFADAIAAAEAGDTVTLLADMNLTCESSNVALVIDKAITIDGDGHKITFAQKAPAGNSSNNYRVFNVTAAGDVVFKNVTIDLSESTHGSWSAVHNRAINVLNGACSLTLENVDIEAGIHYGVYVYGATGAIVTIKDSTISGYDALSIWSDSTINVINSDLIGTAVWNFSHGVINVGGGVPTITIDADSSIKAVANADNEAYAQYAVYVQYEASAENIVINTTDITKVEETDPVIYLAGAEAMIGDVMYKTLAEALAAVGAGDVVIDLVADVTLDYNAREAYGLADTTSITINGNGYTLTLNQKDSDWSSIGLANADAKLIINNATIEKTGYGDTSGAWNTHAINFTCNVEMNDVTVNNSMSVENGATLNNVTINEANGYYGLWIDGTGQTVTINGGEINATNGGRGIKIADEYVDDPAQVTLNVTDMTFNTAKKAAVLVSSTAGAKVTANGCDISGVAEDTVNFVWVDEDWAAYFGNVTATGATVAQENAAAFAIIVKDEDGNIIAYYKTLDDLFASALMDRNDDLTVLLTADVAAEKLVSISDSQVCFNFITEVENGVTMAFEDTSTWNYVRHMTIGKGVTLNVPGYLCVYGGVFDIYGTVNTGYLYSMTGAVTVKEGGTLDVTTGSKTIQVKNSSWLEVYGTVKAGTVNVWNDNTLASTLIVSGANASLTADHVHAWDGGNASKANTITVENGATLTATNLQADRGSEVTVDAATLVADTLTLGYDNNVGKLTATNGSALTIGQMNVAANGSYSIDETCTTNLVAKLTKADGSKVVYTTIQAAMDAAEAGDTVTIFAGEYTGDLSVNKAITVVGETDADGNNLVTINGKLSVTGTGVTVKNLNVNNSSERALYVSGGDILIEGCNLTGVHGLRYCYANNGDVTLRDCVITGSTYGVHFDGGSGEGDVIIDGCTITGWTSFGSAIEGVTITDTEFKDGNYNLLRFYQDATLTNVTFPSGNYADYAGSGMRIDSGNNGAGMEGITLTFEDCKTVDGSTLEGAFPAGVIYNSTIIVDGTTLSIEASVTDSEGEVSYYKTLAEAFAAAKAGDTITLVADITLTEQLIINDNGLLSDVTLDGNGHTIYDAVSGASTICFGSNGYWATGVKIQNLTVQAAEGNVDPYCAIRLYGGTSSVLTNVKVTGNYTYGINFYGTHGATLDNCQIVSAFTNGQAANPLNLTNGTVITTLIANDGADMNPKIFIDGTSSITTLYADDHTAMVDVNSMDRIGTILEADTEVPMVAEINGVQYATLALAVANAEAGDTVTLLRDATGAGVVFENGDNVTIDLNGKTYTLSESVGSSAQYGTVGFYLWAGSNVTIKNGTINMIEDIDGDAYTFFKMFHSYGDLTLTDVTLDCANGVWWNGTKDNDVGFIAIESDNGTVTIDGATSVLNAALSPETWTITAYKNGKITIDTTGTIEGVVASYGSNASVEIKNGYFTNENTAYAQLYTISSGAIAVSGGTFSEAVAEDYCADGFVPTVNADGTYTVMVAGEAVAKIGEIYYKTLNEALAVAQDGDTVTLLTNVEYGTTTLIIDKAITLDLGGYTLTTNGTYGGLQLKNGCSLVNGTLNHKGTVTAIKAWNVATIEDITIIVDFKAEGKTIGGIVLQENCTGIGTLKNVTIMGEGLTNGIETYNCGNATEPVIGSMENVTIDAKGTGMLISAPCGTVTGSTIKGDISGIEIWIKGTYSATLDLVDCTVEGGEQAVYAHDEFSSNPDIENIGTLKLTVGGNTTFINENGALMKLTIARAENVDMSDITDLAFASVDDGETVTYFQTLAEAFAAAQDGDEVKILVAGTYALSTSGKDITITGAVDGVVFDNIGAKNMGGANVTFNNVTFDYLPNTTYTGLQHAGDLVYNDCTFNGTVFLYGASETFNGCTFNVEGDAYNVWTYGAKVVAFNDCTFNSTGKSVLVYNEGACATDLTVTDCTFNASASFEGKAAIEIDTTLMPDGTNIVISNSTATGFDAGSISGSTLWNDKKDLTNLTVTVDSKKVWPLTGEVAYRAYILDTSSREAIQVDLYNVFAKESVVVKLYDAAGNLLTTTTYAAGGCDKTNAYLTCLIVLDGTASSNWNTVKEDVALTIDNAPAKIELYIDGKLLDTFENALGDKIDEYKALDCVYKNIIATDENGNVGYYMTLDELFAADFGTDEVKVELLGNVSANGAVDTTGTQACYNFVTSVEGGVTVTFEYADDWNYVRHMSIGTGVTLNTKYLYIYGGVFDIYGTVTTDYAYTESSAVTVKEGGVLNATTGDATVQVKNNGWLEVYGTVNAGTVNVWNDGSRGSHLIVSGANAQLNAEWIHAWDGGSGSATNEIVVENGATLITDAMQADRGSTVTVDAATLTAGSLTLGYDGNTGTLTVTNNGVVTNGVVLSSVTSTVTGPEGMNVTTTVEGYTVVYAEGVYSVQLGGLTVDGVFYASWADAMAYIVKDSKIVLYADIEYGAAGEAQQKFLANGGTIVIDLNGHTLSFNYTTTIQYNTTVKVIDSKGGGALYANNVAYCLVLGANSVLNLADNVTFDGTLQFNNGAENETGYFQINGDNIIGDADSIFVAADSMVRLSLADDFMEITLNNGHLTLTEDIATLNDQQITLVVNTELTIPEGVTLTIDAGTILTVNGEVNGDGTVVVNSFEHLKAVLATDIKNIVIDSAITVSEALTIDDKDVMVTGMANVNANGNLTLMAGTYDMDVNAYCAEGYCAKSNGNGTWTVSFGLVKNETTGVLYASLADAVADVNSGETLVLITDITAHGVTIGLDTAVKITIDLNGYTITSTDLTLTAFRSGTELTLKNGTIAGNSTGGTIKATYGGKLILGENLTVTSGSKANAIVVDNGTLEVSGADVEVNGGIYSITTNGEDTKNITISDGVFNGDLNINEYTNCVITGGTFTMDVNEWCADGYYARDNGDGTWTVVEKFEIDRFRITIVNSFKMDFLFNASNMTDWTDYYVEIVRTYANGTEDEVITIPASEWITYTLNGTAYYMVSYDDIAAKEMNDSVKVTVYNADGVAVSVAKNTSVVDYAMGVLTTEGDNYRAMDTLVVDMLNYGAAAQTTFGYDVDNLANAKLSAEQLAMATETVECEDTRDVSADKVGAFYNSRAVLSNNISFQMAFNKHVVDVSSSYAVFTYTNHYGDAISIRIEASDFATSGDYYIISLDTLVIADARQDVTCTIYNGDGTVATAVTDSLESYTARASGTNSEQAAVALLKFADSAYAYLHRNDASNA